MLSLVKRKNAAIARLSAELAVAQAALQDCAHGEGSEEDDEAMLPGGVHVLSSPSSRHTNVGAQPDSFYVQAPQSQKERNAAIAQRNTAVAERDAAVADRNTVAVAERHHAAPCAAQHSCCGARCSYQSARCNDRRTDHHEGITNRFGAADGEGPSHLHVKCRCSRPHKRDIDRMAVYGQFVVSVYTQLGVDAALLAYVYTTLRASAKSLHIDYSRLVSCEPLAARIASSGSSYPPPPFPACPPAPRVANCRTA